MSLTSLFYRRFLGAAGVMYTSFLGLIVDAALSYGDSKSTRVME